MKKKILSVLSLSIFLLGITSCQNKKPEENKPIEVTISEDCPKMVECGKTITLLADIANSKQNVTWSIDDPLVGTIDENGVFKGLTSGTVHATATSIEDPEISDEVSISVKNNTLIEVKITNRITNIKVGDEVTLNASIENDTTNSGIGWQVNNEALGSIDENGKLKIIQQGVEKKIIVTAYSLINPNAYEDMVINISPSNDGKTQIDNQVETKSDYKLIFADHFNGKRLNKANWEVMTGTGTKYGVGDGWGNGEQQFYLEDNLKANEGNLIITAKREKGRTDTRGKTYTSGRIRSKAKVAHTYGRIEAKISCPFGNGLWPAFWMLPENTSSNMYGPWPNSGEIDIMEARGRQHFSIDGTIHFADEETGNHTWLNGTYTFPLDQDISQEHIYAVEWEEGSLKWYVDDNLYYTCDETQNKWTIQGDNEFPKPFDQDFHILFNMAIGGNYDGNRLPDNKDLPARMKVDYVKWYQKGGN